MSRNFNPFQPDVQGNEWLADLEGNPTVPTLGNVPGLTFTPLATDQANADWKWAYCYIFARPEAGAAWLNRKLLIRFRSLAMNIAAQSLPIWSRLSCGVHNASAAVRAAVIAW